MAEQPTVSSLVAGMNMNSVVSQLKPSEYSYALNAIVEGVTGNSYTLQNEQGNVFCTTFPDGMKVVGAHNIIEKNIIIFWLTDDVDSEIGTVNITTCLYTKFINSSCIGLSTKRPILKAVHKISNCSTEVFWTDGTKRKWMDLENPPYKEIINDGECAPVITDEIDCNKLLVQPNFSIPQLDILSVDTDGEIQAGTVQFAIQYANASGEAYTAAYSVTNPLSIFDSTKITEDFNYLVNKSVDVKITNIDTTGFFDYFNLIIIKTVNNITTPYLVGTYNITGEEKTITYTGQNQTELPLTLFDVMEKYPIYDEADDLTTAQDILIWKGLKTSERLNYQKIWNKVHLQWQTNRLRGDKPYADELNVVDKKGYFRDEIYPFEGVFLLKNGFQTDKFPIPGRIATAEDLEIIFNNDTPQDSVGVCEEPEPKRRWQVYNTGSVTNYEQQLLDAVCKPSEGHYGPGHAYIPGVPCDESIYKEDECYEGPFQYGEFAYWESTELYPCNKEVWGELADTPIRHHKFPDSLITHIHDDAGFIYPIGIKVDVQALIELIRDSDLTEEQKNNIVGFKIVRGNRANNKSVIARGLLNTVGTYSRGGNTVEDQENLQTYFFPNYPFNDRNDDVFLWNTSYLVQDRWTFNSPDTSFYQPSLGNILKLETVEYGIAKTKFVQVKNNAKNQIYTTNLYVYGYAFGALIAGLGIGLAGLDWAGGATVMTMVIDVFQKIVPFINYGYQYNAVGNYSKYIPIANDGDKQRNTLLAQYAIPGVLSTGDIHPLNNWQRQSSVFLKTNKTLPFADTYPSIPEDNTRWTLGNTSEGRVEEKNTAAYYATIKKQFVNQYGLIDSYQSIDTGIQRMIDINVNLQPEEQYIYGFGGDCFINRFAYKNKIPFFIDNRVDGIPGSDVFYDEIGNVGYPKYWYSTDIDTSDFFGAIFAPVQKSNLDGQHNSNSSLNKEGKMYLFAYGIPYFFTESEVNVDNRQAYNSKEGDFYPHVASDIPDEWLQETNVSIAYDNTYYYNKTYSKQNKENEFTNLPIDWSNDRCKTEFPYRAIFSERQINNAVEKKNNWLVYRPASRFDFPQNNGRLVSIDGIENRQVLARFENKMLLYNALLTMPTSTTQAYLGQSLFDQNTPPLDYSDTDLGYIGTQHKLFLKTEYGNVSFDAKRGMVFLINGQQAKDITGNCSKFLAEFLYFAIKESFPEYNIDNSFNGCGLTGVYDSKYTRIIFTKIDYKPIVEGITYDGDNFLLDGNIIELTNTAYFCNYSFTMSYSFKTQNWASFHSYIPNYYIGHSSFFYSGVNDSTPSIWTHGTSFTLFNNYYGSIELYIIEYPLYYKGAEEILQGIRDYTQVLQYTNYQELIETDDVYFSEAIVYNNQQCSGTLKLTKKPKNNLQSYSKYPIYSSDNKEILFTKSNSMYQFNTFWALQKTSQQPMWNKSCENLSIFKELNNDNMNYSKRSYNKAPIMSKGARIRLINNTHDDVNFVSTFLLSEIMTSFK